MTAKLNSAAAPAGSMGFQLHLVSATNKILQSDVPVRQPSQLIVAVLLSNFRKG